MENREYTEQFYSDPQTKFAKGYLENSLADYPIIFEGDRNSTLHRIFEREEDINSVSNGTFSIDYRKYFEPEKKRPNQIRFEYAGILKDQSDQKVPVAEMHLDIIEPQLFLLVHRYIMQGLKRKGLGTKLWIESEEWLKQITKVSDRPVTIEVQTGQLSVINWTQRRGFEISENHVALLEEVQTHPENFIEDEVIVNPGSQSQRSVKDPYMFRKDTKERHMEDAIRLTFRKILEPEG